MRTLLLIVVASWCSGRGDAGDLGNNATLTEIVNAVEKALRQIRPLSDGGLVVSDAEVALAIHRAVASAVSGRKRIDSEQPNRAIRSCEQALQHQGAHLAAVGEPFLPSLAGHQWRLSQV